MSDNLHTHVVETERCGAVKVFVMGDIDAVRRGGDHGSGNPVFLTVHDIGKNHNSWLNFIYHPSMNNIRERAVFINVDLLGQEDDAEDLGRMFPSLQQIGEDLINILDNLRVKTVIGLGDGAGANILLRFELMHNKRCLGVLLINPTATAATFMEQFKDKFALRFPSLTQSSENYLILHRFGYKLEDIQDDEDLAKALDDYKDKIREAKINPKNSKLYVDAFVHRDDITAKLKNIPDDMILIAGARSAYVANMELLFTFCDKTKVSILKIDDVGDVMEEAPAKLANSLLLFCKGLGWLTTLITPGVERQRSASQSSTGSGSTGGRRMSMEEYDRPNIRRLSLTGTTSTGDKDKDKDKE